MRREKIKKSRSLKFFYVMGILILIFSIILVVSYRVYNKKLSQFSDSMLSTEKVIGLVPNTSIENNNDLESASSSLSKTIEEVSKENEVEEDALDSEALPTLQEEEKIKSEPKKELSFVYPVAGEVVKKFSTDNLVYSETLEEWTTHQGIDIKADRTTVVTAAEDGVVVAIKNDPRYGLTVIVEHEDGFKTVYSNLLTTEFVVEDERVTKGQSLGTVGNSAIFEIADEPHLHFEMIKDGEYVDPELYIK